MRIARIAAVGLSLAAGLAGALLVSPTDAAEHARQPDSAAAASAFLKSLPAELRTTRPAFRSRRPSAWTWNFVPMDRVGVSLLKLDDAQSELLGPLLATALSPEGLLAARGVMKHENILRRVETEAGVANASRRDPGLYYTAIFGKPARAGAWGWRFEGHHLSINVTEFPGEAPVVAPMFVGANPARVLAGPNAGFRLLAAEEDLGRELIKMLPASRREIAMIRDTAFSEILTGNDPKVQKLELAGLAAAEMTAEEKAQLRAPHRAVRRAHGAGLRQGRAVAPRSGRFREGALCLGRWHRARAAALLPRARPDAAHRVRRHAEQRQPHPHRVSRSRTRLRWRCAARALSKRTIKAIDNRPIAARARHG